MHTLKSKYFFGPFLPLFVYGTAIALFTGHKSLYLIKNLLEPFVRILHHSVASIHFVALCMSWEQQPFLCSLHSPFTRQREPKMTLHLLPFSTFLLSLHARCIFVTFVCCATVTAARSKRQVYNCMHVFFK